MILCIIYVSYQKTGMHWMGPDYDMLIVAEEIPHLLLTGSTLNQWMKWEQEKIDMFLIPLTKVRE